MTTLAFIEWCRSLGYFFAVLFIDLSSAFDGVIRELLVGSPLTVDQVSARFLSFGIDPVHVGPLAERAVLLQPILQEAGVPPECISLVRSLLSTTWNAVDGCSTVCRTVTGARPGNAIADVLFGFMSLDAFREIQINLEAEGLHNTLGAIEGPRWDQGFFGDSAHQSTPLSPQVYVDDGALYIFSLSPELLLERLRGTATVAISSFTARGFRINTGPSKTAVMIGGRNASWPMFAHLFDYLEGAPVLDVVGLLIPCVDVYTHTGVTISDRGTVDPDVRRKVMLTKATAALCGGSLFTGGVPTSVRLGLGGSVLWTRLLSASHVWPRLSRQSAGQLEQCRLKIIRGIVHERAIVGGSHFSDTEILNIYGLESSVVLRRRARLNFASRVLRSSPTLLKSLLFRLGPSGSWNSLLFEDLSVLHQCSDRVSSLDPTCLGPWRDSLVTCPSQWNIIVKRAAFARVAAYPNDRPPPLGPSTQD
jgi:hypothetical protein